MTTYTRLSTTAAASVATLLVLTGYAACLAQFVGAV